MAKTNHNLYITNHRKKAAEISPNEFYSTNPKSVETFVDEFLNYPLALKTYRIWEPACGRGNISRYLESQNFIVESTDLVDRGFGKGNIDFLQQMKLPRHDINVIMTNPPFSLAEEFIRKSLELLPDNGYCIMYLKLTFLEGKKRYELFRQFNPEFIYVHSSRQGCSPQGELDFPNGGSVAFCWWIWRKGFKGETTMKWLPPN